MCLIILPSRSLARNLGLKVAGKEITNTNASDILSAIGMGEGKMWYDEKTRTLTLENVILDSDRENVIESTKKISKFTIRLIGYNKLTQRGAARMFLSSSKNVITGTGTLEVSSPQTQGIFVDLTELEINGGCTVIAKGSWGICSDGDEGKLTVNASKVVAEGGFGSICDFANIELIDCAITSPANCYHDYGSVVDGYDNIITSQVVIDKVSSSYDIEIGGVKVDDSNAEDIFGDYTAEYKPETKTLYLRNANIATTDVPAIKTSSEIIVDLTGKNVITSDVNALDLGASAMFRGKGLVNITSENAAGVKITSGELEVFQIDGFEVKGKQGIAGAADEEGNRPMMRITRSKVKTQGDEMSLGGFEKIIMDGCHIFEPQNAVVENGTVCADGKICTGEVLIKNTIEYPLWIAGIPVTSLNYRDVLGDGTAKVDIENKTVTLNNFKYITHDASAGLAVQSAMGHTNVILKGENVINTPYIGVICSSDVSFTGEGTLDVTGNSAGMVIQECTVAINDEPTMSIRGDQGITSMSEDGNVYGILYLDGADLSVEGSSLGSIIKLEAIELNNCVMKTPADAVIEGGTVMLDGDICREMISFESTVAKSIDTAEKDKACITAAEGRLVIYGVTAPVSIMVSDMSGRQVFGGVIAKDTEIMLNQGIYVVVCGSEKKKIIL